MAKTMLLTILRILMMLIFALWILLWFLKPTNSWTKNWKAVEDNMQTTIIKYNGVDFVVYTFPIILLAMVGILYLYLQSRSLSKRGVRRCLTAPYNPLIVKSPLGMLSGIDVLVMSLVLTLLVWTFYARISNDFKKLLPAKSLKLNVWQLKFLKMSTRFGLMMEICLAFLLFPILRGLSIFRLLGIQFEGSVRYHIWLGTLMTFFAVLHGGGTLFIWGINHHVQNQMWGWQKEGRIYLAGVIALVTLLVIWSSSLPLVRRRKFDVFFSMHHLYVVFLVFFMFHAGDKHFYMVFAGVFLFAIDKLIRVIQSRPETCILSARIFPSKVIELTIPKDPGLNYTPTSIIFLKIPMISKFHSHPFSICSSSTVNNQTMSVMIKCEGHWTNSLYNILCQKVEPNSQTKCIPVAVEGPYGPPSFDFIRYDNLLLIAGGIGITPILSILQEIASVKGDFRNRFHSQIQLIYIAKKSQDISLLNPISHLVLNNQISEFCHLKMRIFVTQEKKGGSSLRELMSSFSIDRSILLDTKNSSYTFGTGQSNPVLMGAVTGFSSVIFLLSLCFFNQFISEPKKKLSKPGSPSSVVDLFLVCSFLIAVASGALVAMVFKWRNARREILSTTWDDRDEDMKLNTMEGASTTTIEEHEIHYGGRPIFKELLPEMESEFKGSNVGVVVCGPETMKESVASACQQKYRQAFKLNSKKQQQQQQTLVFVFHSLNFSL